MQGKTKGVGHRPRGANVGGEREQQTRANQCESRTCEIWEYALITKLENTASLQELSFNRKKQQKKKESRLGQGNENEGRECRESDWGRATQAGSGRRERAHLGGVRLCQIGGV